MAIEFEGLNLKFTSTASDTAKSIDKTTKALEGTAKASSSAAKGVSEIDTSMKAAQLESKRLSAELAKVTQDLNTQKAAFKSQNQQVQQSFSSIQAVFSTFTGTLSKPLFALQRLAQAQDQMRQTAALAGAQAQQSAIRQQQAALQQVQYTIAQQQAMAQLAQQQQATAAQDSANNEQKKLSWAEANQQLMELEGKQAGYINLLRDGKTVFEALAEAQEKAGEAGEKVPESTQKSASAVEALQNTTQNLTNSLQGVSQVTQSMTTTQSTLAQGFLSTASAQQVATAATGSLSQAAIGLNAALGPLQPILLAIAAVIKAVEIAANAQKKALERVKKSIDDIVKAGKKVISVLQKIGTAFQNIARAVGNAISGAAEFVKNITAIDKSSKKAGNSTDKLSKLLRKAWNVLQIKLLRNAINSLFQKTSEGFQQLAMDSAVFNQSMSAGVSAVRGTSNALVAALAPAINAVMPLLLTLANALRNVLNLFAALTAALFGQSTYFVANDVWEDYAAGASNAAGAVKEVDEAVNRLNFDELTTIADVANGGGGGGAGGGGNWFTEMETPNWEDIFAGAYDWAYDITTQFLDWLSDIDWNAIKAQAYMTGQFFGNIVSGAIDAWFEYEDPRVVGRSIAEFLNSALELVSGYLDTLEFVDSSGLNRFQKLGHQIGENIDEAIKTFDWPLLARDITGLINGAIQIAASATASLVNNDTWYELGFNLFNTLGSVLRDLNWNELGDTLVNGIKLAIRYVQGAVDGWGEADVGLGARLAELAMRVIRETPWDEAATALSDVVLYLLRELNSFIAGLEVADIIAAIKTFLNNIKWDEIQEELGILWDNVWDILLTLPEELDIPWLGTLLGVIREKFEDIPGAIESITTVLSNVDWAAVLELVAIAAAVLAAILLVNLVTSVISAAIAFIPLYAAAETVYTIFNFVTAAVEAVSGVLKLLKGDTEGAAEAFENVNSKIESALNPFSVLTDTGSYLGRVFGFVSDETDKSADSTREHRDATIEFGDTITEVAGDTSTANSIIAETSETAFSKSREVMEGFATALQTEIPTAYDVAGTSTDTYESNTTGSFSALLGEANTLSTGMLTKISGAFDGMGVKASEYENLSSGLLDTSYNEYAGTYQDVYDTVAKSLDDVGNYTEKTNKGIEDNVTTTHKTLLTDFSATLDTAGEELSEFRDNVESNVIDSLTSAWQHHGWVFSTVVDDMAKAYKGATNLMIGYTNAMISGVTSGVNVLIDAINSLRVDVPSWVPDIGGKNFKPSLTKVSSTSIPMLAEGGVIPANKPFLALMGEQKHGTNVEAPLSTIQQALANVLASPVQPGGVSTAGAMSSFTAGSYSATGSIEANVYGNVGSDLAGAVSSALQQNASLFEQGTLIIADEQVAKANENYHKNRGVALGGAFATSL